jgi:hypothetical protein
MPRTPASGVDFERLLAESFRRAHWRVRGRSRWGDLYPDFVVDAGDKMYIVELKRSSEGRGDRLIPLLAQTILQAQAIARQAAGAAVPVAVVAAERVSPSVAEQVKQFGAQFAFDVGVGVIDSHGLRAFAGHGLEALDAQPTRLARSERLAAKRLPHLFSDLNSWLLKVLLGQSLPESVISVPRARFRNATQLAATAQVSVMSASRFLRQLENEGFLDERAGLLAVARAEDLLARWVAANRQAVRDIPACWIIRKEEKQLFAAIKSYTSEPSSVPWSDAKPQPGANPRVHPRCAIGLFAAADALGLGFVHGVPPYVYLERVNPDIIRRLGLSIEEADRRADVFIRIPAHPESVFRAAVLRDGLPVTDALQVWLDSATHPTRGRAQADEIRRRALGPLFGKP